jgi:hypothetical protein
MTFLSLRPRGACALTCALAAAACAGDAAEPAGDPNQPCAITVFSKNCAAAAGCHAPPNSPMPGDAPAITGFDLSPSGIKAAHDGADFVGKHASDSMEGLCGASAKPPLSGMLIVDPNDPKSSLLYDKLSAVPECGSPMPLVGKALNASDKQCILSWIEGLPGVAGAGDGG